MKLGDKLKFLRERSGLTQVWLGQKLGYNNRVISKWENNISVPSAQTLFNLAKIYDVKLEQLLDDNFKFVDSDDDAEEILDVLQEDGTKTGFTATKSQIHKRGLWHNEVACWIANRKSQYLLLKRLGNKDFKPNKWGIVAGHVQSGESNIAAVERALRRELNLNSSNYSFKTLITNKQKQTGVKFKLFNSSAKVHNSGSGALVNKRITTSYILFLDIPIESVAFNKKEFSEIRFFSIPEIRELIQNGDMVYDKEYDLDLLAEGLDIDLIDIVDEKNNLTGNTEEKQDVHNKGLWHREALIFLCNELGQVLTYRRVESTKVQTGVVVPFFGGHVLSGESYEEAIIRECVEETGFKPDKVTFLQQAKGESESKLVTNRRFTNYYIAKCPNNLEEFNFSSFEINEPCFVNFNDLYNILKTNPRYKNRFEKENFDELLEMVGKFIKKIKKGK